MNGDARQDIQDLVGEIVDGVRSFAPVTGARFPKYDLLESAEEYVALFDVPGMARTDIEIQTEGDQVIVSGEREAVEAEVRKRRVERPFGSFRRVVRVPADVDLDGIRAALADGVLTVTFPKRGDRTGRRVDIES